MTDFVFLFPGQGSQSKGMLDAFDGIEVIERTLEEASDALGYDMAALIRDDADDMLGQTEFTQPALLTASTAILRLWRERGGPDAAQVAGHSLGEYSALVAAGAIDFSDAVRLVEFRGRAMTDAVAAGVGKMAAILGLDDGVVEELCAAASDDDEKVWAANYNCPGQLVVAGHAAAVERMMVNAKAAGARRALPLAVSAPSHTPLMQPAADAMAARLQEITIHAPACPVWSNANAAPEQDVARIRTALVAQLVSPVRWTETVQKLAASGIRQGVEMGPGKVLSGLVKRIDSGMQVGVSVNPGQIEASLAMIAGE
ncbi:ACP S-malonyltransferase [Mariprofundus ferrooxydans]|uniref:Malonyl CoA-acyl carrier protein transacylase n=1 Tax=Mariprofundus ferrooxydans PV-1 TaxID=314345 RepID=Q0F0G3_9PROT|nr:ACP S-malonyltransferase [Mariprofundus ferrooxydans]EAU55065.1 acyl carrier protein S-malonyltransferase [Mariprofundus ferrooxydans PV-1]KON46892.1 malonyl CoA-ACP transacylase [Mariprofundus ferrooxydans]